MATFTITTTQNIDELTGKTGGDIYNINGGTLTIDQHSRFGLNNANTSATAATSMGNITISATLGGTLNIDGRYIRRISFTGGSGTIPALNTLITQGGASGKLMCVYSTGTAAPITSGTMPASGWIMVKQWNGIDYTAGALSSGGITATVNSSGVGFLEIFGDDASTLTANRLGTVNITGAWLLLGTTSGTSNQTVQIPNHGTLKHIAGVYIEKTAGAKDYEFYPNAGTVTTIGTDAYRGKVVWIDNTGLVRIGNSGAATNGYTPPAGLEVVVPNIFLQCCTTAARNAEVIPNATVATRYDWTTTGGGVINIDKAQSAWYFSCSQAYSVNVSNSCFVDAISLSEVATSMTWSKVGVGNKPTTALLTNSLTMTYCYAGGTFTDCVWTRVSMAASGAHTNVFTDCSDFTFVRNTFRANTIRANATTYALNGTRLANFTFTDCTVIQGALFLATCTNVNTNNLTYIEAVSGTTVTTYAGYVWNISSNTSNCTFDGLNMPVTNTQPYTALLFGATACSNIKLRNIGTYASPRDMGSTNACGLVFTLASGCNNFKIQRVHVVNTRTGLQTGDNSCKNILMENVSGDYADAADVSAMLNFTQKAQKTTKALTAQTSVYGTHWMDYHTSTTAGCIAIVMNEPTADTASQVTLANGANFNSAGGVYMPVIGHSVTFELPYYLIGHTGFANSALIMAGGTATNYTYEYSIDKNDGAGWSTMTTANYTATTLGTALNGITGIDASKGFKLRLKITTTVTNTTAITSVYMTTTSTTTTQAYTYPLDTITLTLNGLVAGSDIVILDAGTETERVNVDANPTTSYNYVYETISNVDIKVYKRGYVPFSIMNYALGSSNASLPVAQVADRNYIE